MMKKVQIRWAEKRFGATGSVTPTVRPLRVDLKKGGVVPIIHPYTCPMPLAAFRCGNLPAKVFQRAL